MFEFNINTSNVPKIWRKFLVRHFFSRLVRGWKWSQCKCIIAQNTAQSPKVLAIARCHFQLSEIHWNSFFSRIWLDVGYIRNQRKSHLHDNILLKSAHQLFLDRNKQIRLYLLLLSVVFGGFESNVVLLFQESCQFRRAVKNWLFVTLSRCWLFPHIISCPCLMFCVFLLLRWQR